MKIYNFFTLSLLTYVLAACEDNSNDLVTFSPLSTTCYNLTAQSPDARPNWQNEVELEVNEAYYLAMEVEQGFLPSESVYNNIKNDLNLIRTNFKSDSATTSSVAPCNQLPLLIGLEEDAFNQVSNGDFPHWQELNDVYGVSNIKLYPSNLVILEFDREFNALSLKAEYEKQNISGIKYIETNSTTNWGRDVCTEVQGDTRYYVFMEGHGNDCMAGCANSFSGYKIENETQVTHLGKFNYDQSKQLVQSWFSKLKQCPIHLQGAQYFKI